MDGRGLYLTAWRGSDSSPGETESKVRGERFPSNARVYPFLRRNWAGGVRVSSTTARPAARTFVKDERRAEMQLGAAIAIEHARVVGPADAQVTAL